MKKIFTVVLALLMVALFGVFALGSGESSSSGDQGSGSAEAGQGGNESLGDYSLVIDSCRLAKSYDNKDVVIVKYKFTNNNNEDGASFSIAFDDKVYQNGVGLNGAYVLDDSANYSADNQTKNIQKGATLDVEVAYELNDSTTDIVVEVKEFISFNDKKITKTFKIAQ